MKETRLPSLGWEDPLEKEMETCFSMPAWEIPKSHGQGSLVCYSQWGHKRVRHKLATEQQKQQAVWCQAIHSFNFSEMQPDHLETDHDYTYS